MTPSLNDLEAALAPLLAPTAEAALTPGVSHLVDATVKGYHLDVPVLPGQLLPVAELLNQQGFAIDTITGVDWLAAGQMEIVYDFFHPAGNLHVVIRTRVPRENPEVPTLSRVFPGANWHERETHEFFGIRFLGHPNLTPLLLPEDATFHPLRKDYAGAA
jgi:NADH-quinone oxidoreductase subunit C